MLAKILGAIAGEKLAGQNSKTTGALIGAAVPVIARRGLGREDDRFEIAVLGVSERGQGTASPYFDGGATWWLESLSPMRGSLDEL